MISVAGILSLVLPVVATEALYNPRNNLELYVLIGVATTSTGLALAQVQEFLNLDVRVYRASQGYVDMQILSQDFESIKDKPGLSFSDVKVLIGRYQNLLKMTENHSGRDYKKTKNQG